MVLLTLVAGLVSLLMTVQLPTAAALPQGSAGSAAEVPMGDPRFGIHPNLGAPDSPPAGVFGVERLWDTGAIWCRMNPAPGVWDFTALIQQLESASRRGARSAVVVLGFPPAHAVADNPGVAVPNGREAGWLCPDQGYGSMLPNDAVWGDYVRRTAEQVHAWRVVHPQVAVHFQVWNEPALRWFLHPDHQPQRLIDLAAVARQHVRAVLPDALILSPSIVRNRTARVAQWQEAFVDAAHMWSTRNGPLFDVWTVHLYPIGRTFDEVWAGPRGYGADLAEVSATVAAGRTPGDRLWITEINANVAIESAPAVMLSDADQAAFVGAVAADTLARGIEVVVWYRWHYEPWQLGHGQIVLSRQAAAMSGWPRPAG